jgi:hypothetical protein
MAIPSLFVLLDAVIRYRITEKIMAAGILYRSSLSIAGLPGRGSPSCRSGSHLLAFPTT